MANVDLTEFELHNVFYSTIRGLYVREALVSHSESSDFQSGAEFIYGFSIESANTSEVFHYLIIQKTASLETTIFVVNEEYQTVLSFSLGPVPKGTRFYYATQQNQILINAEGLSAPVYGIVGGGLARAEKQDSINVDTTAIDIPTGPCCTFGDRVAIGFQNQVYFNDPGTEIRTFVGENGIAFPGKVLDLFQAGNAGALYVFCSDAIYVIPPDALGQGQIVYGFVSRIPNYQAYACRNATYSRGQILALTKSGLVNVDSLESVEFSNQNFKRFYSSPVGATLSGDYRFGSIWPGNDGVWVSIDGKLCYLDLESGKSSWVYDGYGDTELELVGMLKSRDGIDLLVTKSNVFELIGNNDFAGFSSTTGVVCGQLPTPPELSLVWRHITTASDNTGYDQLVYVRGSSRERATGIQKGGSGIVGTNTWSASNLYVENEFRSARHAVNIRGDAPMVEFGVEGNGYRIYPIATLESEGYDTRRPHQ